MEYVILGLLICTHQTIYSLNKMFNEIISLFYHASYGSLGTTLKKLESKKLIESDQKIENGRHKKYYSVTEQGKTYWKNWMTSDFDVIRPSLFYTKIFFLGLITDHKEKIKIVSNMTQLVQFSYNHLEDLSLHVPKVIPNKSLQAFLSSQLDMLDLGLKSTETELKWLKNHLQKIRKEIIDENN